MKKKFIACVIAVLFAMTSLTAFASEEDELPSLDTEYGVYQLLGCDFFTNEDDNIIIIFSEYENTTDENTDAGMEYYIEAFQDGISLDSAYFSSSVYDISSSQWPDAKSSSTELQPGGNIVYYKAFKLSSNSDVVVEISTLWGWGDDEVSASYTFECGEAVASSAGDSDDTSEDYETMYYELLEEYEQLKADYDALAWNSEEEPSEGPAASDENTDSGELTMGQKNALGSAESYLNYTAFSYSGLIDQLEFEGYSTEDATYAADNCGADWNEQAVKSAESYLNYSSFSRDSLISQLEFDGFTTEQAEYAADSVGY